MHIFKSLEILVFLDFAEIHKKWTVFKAVGLRIARTPKHVCPIFSIT